MDKLIIIVIILLIIGYIYIQNNNNNNTNITNSERFNELNEPEDYKYLDDIFDNIEYKKINNNRSIIKTKRKIETKPYFINMRVHNDYRDTITAFNFVAPDQRPIFNRSVLPVKQIDVNPREVKPLVKAFIRRVNEEVKNNVTDELKANSGWDELAKEKTKDGWGDYMKEFGLPESIYLSPAKRARVRLIKIDAVEKFATEEQINFIIHMIIQKKNAEDQMILKVSYIMDNKDINSDRNFNNKESDVNLNVRIEEIAVIGFLTDHKYGDPTDRKDFYEFTNIEKDDIIDQELVLKQLQEKYKQRQIEADGFNVNISPQKLNETAIFRLSSETPYKPMEHTNKF
jgi:hypothetical protein